MWKWIEETDRYVLRDGSGTVQAEICMDMNGFAVQIRGERNRRAYSYDLERVKRTCVQIVSVYLANSLRQLAMVP